MEMRERLIYIIFTTIANLQDHFLCRLLQESLLQRFMLFRYIVLLDNKNYR